MPGPGQRDYYDPSDPVAPVATYSDPYVASGPAGEQAQPPREQQVLLPLMLFLLTCYTTYKVGVMMNLHTRSPQQSGLMYSVAVMTILLCHELGHYIQARRYGVPATLPLFIPMPLGPLGTMGAVIAMRGNMGNRRSLFDIGITGPLAGLVPALICCIWGLQHAMIAPFPPGAPRYGDPLILQFFYYLRFGPLPPGFDVVINPIFYAGWVGIFITALNLFPIGQLDGGHVLYALMRSKAHRISAIVLFGSIAAVIYTENWGWSVMLLLLFLIGPYHPPTANDNVPLGVGRTILGWLTLAFVIVGFTPNPFPQVERPQSTPRITKSYSVAISAADLSSMPVNRR